MNSYRKHKQRWIKCLACKLHKARNRVVLARGMVPAKIVLIGEAPGASEDVLGVPFIGPAGKLLDRMLSQAEVRNFVLTNLVACIPKEKGSKLGEPPKECIKACSPRLQQFVAMCKPKLIVCIGALAEKYVTPMYQGKIELVSITHPAAILRMDAARQGLAYQRVVVRLRDAMEDL